MGYLQLFDGPETEQPRIYSFERFLAQQAETRDEQDEVVSIPISQRARMEFRNRCCPRCRRATVENIELHDGRVSRNGAIIFGTATLIGFSCNACGHEWDAR